MLALKEDVFKCFIRRSAASAREVAAAEGSGAGSEGVGDAAHAHERFGVLQFVEAAGAAVKWGEEGIKTRFLVPLPSTEAKVGKVLCWVDDEWKLVRRARYSKGKVFEGGFLQGKGTYPLCTARIAVVVSQP